MKATKNIARLAVTAGLTAALSFGGVMAPVTMAFAEGTPTVAPNGIVTIDEQTYKDTTFKGIQIFKATVTQDLEGTNNWNGIKTLSDIEWAGGEDSSVKNAVIHAFDGDVTKPADLPTGDSAQAWAEFINNHGSEVVDKNVNAGIVLDKIAAAVEKANISESADGWVTAGSNGSFGTLATGYWLFVTKDVSTSTNPIEGNTDTFTSPIFAVVGGSAENLTPKKKVPTVTKAVRDDKDGSSFGTDVFENPNMAADSRMDQFIDYQLAGTVAGNINTYSTYKYAFTDKLPESMTPKFKDGSTTPDVTVKIDNIKVSSGFDVDYNNNVLTVSFTDLKDCKKEGGDTIALNGYSKVTVDYQAKLDSTKIFDENNVIRSDFEGLVGKAQKNEVKLTYSNNPHGDGEGATVIHPAYDYTYGIDVTKVGSDTVNGKNPPLSGVKFTLQEKNGDTTESKYIDAKGVKHNEGEVVELTTDNNGRINVVGLDEGTYVLKEVTPAPGYNNSAKDGVTFAIRPTLNQVGQDVTLSGSTIEAGLEVVKDGATTTEVGKLSFTIVDKKGSSLPLTGLNGVTFTWIAGGAVLCIGVAHLIRSRKRDEGSEE